MHKPRGRKTQIVEPLQRDRLYAVAQHLVAIAVGAQLALPFQLLCRAWNYSRLMVGGANERLEAFRVFGGLGARLGASNLFLQLFKKFTGVFPHIAEYAGP